MRKNKITRLLSPVVGAAGIAVMIGWIFDIGVLKSVSPDWISMKFDTALAFFFTAISLYYFARALEDGFDEAQVVLSITSLIILLLMGILFFSAVLNLSTGAEELFVKERVGAAAKTVVPGRPSIPTMINFLLIALAGILTILRSKELLNRLRMIGSVIGTIGALAFLGYIFNVPGMYYFLEGINSAMALPTAVLFMITGIGLVCLSE